MTEYQKSKIYDLRFKGMGYKAISNVLGLSRDTVRAFCKKYGLEGDGVVSKENYELKKENGVLCVCCGTPLRQTSHGRKRRFCSDECRRKWWKENADMGSRKETAVYKLVCAFCNTEFESYGNKNRKYCCHKCYIKDRFGGEINGI